MANTRSVQITTDSTVVEADLTVPTDTYGIVLFAHGSGSSRFSPRNRYVAQVLNHAGLATLLIDLLTDEEEQVDLTTRRLRFDIVLLAGRLMAATEWAGRQADLQALKAGYFGASTGAAAALVAAAKLPGAVQAIVSRGGRPDLAGPVLQQVRVPTLLIVGGYDYLVLDLNKQAMEQLASASKELLVVPGATHLFEEEGALEEVAREASEWFRRYLSPA